MSLRFNTQYEHVLDAGEKNSGEIVVEKAGYIPAEVQITNLIRSGQDLMRYRQGLYYANYGGKDDKEAFENEDPTRSPGFDMIDAAKMMEAESDRLLKKAAELREVAVLKEKAEAEKVQPTLFNEPDKASAE